MDGASARLNRLRDLPPSQKSNRLLGCLFSLSWSRPAPSRGRSTRSWVQVPLGFGRVVQTRSHPDATDVSKALARAVRGVTERDRSCLNNRKGKRPREIHFSARTWLARALVEKERRRKRAHRYNSGCSLRTWSARAGSARVSRDKVSSRYICRVVWRSLIKPQIDRSLGRCIRVGVVERERNAPRRSPGAPQIQIGENAGLDSPPDVFGEELERDLQNLPQCRIGIPC